MAQAKMSLRRAQNIFMPKNVNSITINIFLEGIEKIKTDKNDKKTVWTIRQNLHFSPQNGHNARQSDNNKD